MKLCRAARITRRKERWKTVLVADHVQRGLECQRGVTIAEGSRFEAGATLSQVDDCKVLHPTSFLRSCRLARDPSCLQAMSIVKVQREVDFTTSPATPEGRTCPL